MILSIIFVAVINDNNAGPSSSSSHRRRRHDRLLQEQQVDEELYDDWSVFNNLLLSIELSLPEVDFTQSGVEISISQIVCRDLTVTGMTLDTTSLNATMPRLLREVDGVDVSCTFRWDYAAMLGLSGGGTGNVQTDGSNCQFLPMLISSRWILRHSLQPTR